MKDPYKILGVNKASSIDEIKAAYKKLARKYHPDLNPGNKKSEEKFKEVAHAYDLIGTAKAKEKFDRGETDEQKQQQYEDYVKGQGKQGRPSYHETQDRGGRYSYEYAAGMDEDIFSHFFKNSKGPFTGAGLDLPGEDELYQMEIDFHESAVGVQKILTLPNGKKLQVQIPGGIMSGKKLRFKGQGGAGLGKGPPGDAYVEILVKPSEKFRREGKDIISEVPISFFEAMIGAEVEVETVDGKVLLKIPPGVTTGTKVRIKGRGVGKGEDRGHHLAQIKVVMPKDPPAEFKDSMIQMRKLYDYNPRNHA